jgi:hypothetical protein
MSDPHITTGTTREHVCKCYTATIQRESRGAFLGGIHWSTERHNAPCGLPCLCGGVSPKDYRLGQFHRDKNACPLCAPGSDPRQLP